MELRWQLLTGVELLLSFCLLSFKKWILNSCYYGVESVISSIVTISGAVTTFTSTHSSDNRVWLYFAQHIPLHTHTLLHWRGTNSLSTSHSDTGLVLFNFFEFQRLEQSVLLYMDGDWSFWDYISLLPICFTIQLFHIIGLDSLDCCQISIIHKHHIGRNSFLNAQHAHFLMLQFFFTKRT